MKERPILMTPDNAQKCHEGTKTQTRRTVSVPSWASDEDMLKLAIQRPATGIAYFVDGMPVRRLTCPYGVVGDRLWVREAWAWPGEEAFLYKGNPSDARIVDGWREDKNNCQVKWKQSIHMPRWACRTVLEITGVRVERLQAISEEDAIAEGVTCLGGVNGTYDRDDFSGCWTNYSNTETAAYWNSPIDSYHSLWDSINGVGSWALNPWVWVIEFRRSQS